MERLFTAVEWVYVRTGIGMSLLRVIDARMPPEEGGADWPRPVRLLMPTKLR